MFYEGFFLRVNIFVQAAFWPTLLTGKIAGTSWERAQKGQLCVWVGQQLLPSTPHFPSWPTDGLARLKRIANYETHTRIDGL